MKKKLLLIIILIFTFSVQVFSQKRGKMKGIVKDELGQPIPDVRVKLFSLREQIPFEKKTNNKGVWRALHIRGGRWNIDFIKEGYETKMVTSPDVIESKLRYVVVNITLKKIQKSVVSNKDNLLKKYKEGKFLYYEKKYKEALLLFNMILSKSPETYIINFNVGNCYMKLNDYDKAIESYKKVIKIDSKHIETIIAIGNCYANKNNPKSALKWFGKIDELEVKDSIALYNIGISNFKINKSGDAVKFFELAIKVDDNFQDAYYQLGHAYLDLKKKKAALVVFKKYLELDKNSKRSSEVKALIKQL